MNQTEAIKAAFAELGIDATHEAVRDWLESHEVEPTASFKSIVSHVRRKVQLEAVALTPKPGTVSVDTMIELVNLVGSDVNEFRNQLDRVERAIEIAGGCESLRRFLAVWKVK